MNNPETVIFNNGGNLLIAMIRGRHLKFKGVEYSYSEEGKGSEFYSRKENGDWKVINSIRFMCKVLIGKKVIDVDPIHIPVDTLLRVSPYDNNGKIGVNGQRNRYFSHWDKGRLFAFKDGTTSKTGTGTKDWSNWEFFEQEDK